MLHDQYFGHNAVTITLAQRRDNQAHYNWDHQAVRPPAPAALSGNHPLGAGVACAILRADKGSVPPSHAHPRFVLRLLGKNILDFTFAAFKGI